MSNSNKQMVLILLLIVALLLHMEGFAAGMFANESSKIILNTLIDGVEFRATIDSGGFNSNEKLKVKASYTNKSNAIVRAYGNEQGPDVGAALLSLDNSSRFSYAEEVIAKGSRAILTETKDSELRPGDTINKDFLLLPYYKEGGVIKLAEAGKYMLSLWLSTEEGRVIKADFPVTIERRYGKMFIKA